MGKLDIAAIVFLSLNGYASTPPTLPTVMLSIDLAINGKTISTPKTLLFFNEKGIIREAASGKNGMAYELEFTPHRGEKDTVLIDLSIREISAKGSKLISSSQVITNNHQKATLQQRTEKNTVTLSLMPEF